MNEELSGRLHNWKFESALNYLNNEPENIREIVKELAENYGNIGWITSNSKIKNVIEGKLSVIEDYEPPSLMGMRI